jgi:exodeoxyribonuclease VII large subunit
VEQTGKLALRLATAARRALEAMRAHLRAAQRGLPRLGDLLALPRQRFDAIDRRLGRGLLANTRAHGTRLARCASRLQPRLLEARLQRIRDGLEALGRRADASLVRRIGPRRARLERVAGRLSPQPIVERVSRCAERLANLGRRSRQSIAAQIGDRRRHLDGCAKLLASLSYHGVLQRGYALVRDSEGRTLRSTSQVSTGQGLDIEVADGRIDAQVLGVRGTEATRRQAPPRAPSRSKTGASGGGQGSLF